MAILSPYCENVKISAKQHKSAAKMFMTPVTRLFHPRMNGSTSRN